MTISRPSAYGEYEPYRFVDAEEEFIDAVIDMQSNIIGKPRTNSSGQLFLS